MSLGHRFASSDLITVYSMPRMTGSFMLAVISNTLVLESMPLSSCTRRTKIWSWGACARAAFNVAITR